jgi:hypothetical protein
MASRKPFSISTLLEIGGQRLGALRAGAERARSTLTQVEAALPPELLGKVHAASFDAEGVLTILVDSGAYATRLRYALPEILPKVLNDAGTAASRGKIQVRPRGTGRS